MKDKPMCKGEQLLNMSTIFFRLMTTSHNAIPEPCTSMEMVVLPRVLNKKEKNKTLLCEVLFRAKYTEINQEKVRKNGPTGAVVRASPSYDVVR